MNRPDPQPATPSIRFATGTCSLGFVLVAMSGRGICAIAMDDTPSALTSFLRDKFPHSQWVDDGSDELSLSLAKVTAMVEAPDAGFDASSLDMQGTAFQLQVWLALREIPAGTTCSYSELAKRIGLPKAVRAVAGACAANKLAIAVPCHRVLKQDGGLSGYRWGIGRKAELLRREGVTTNQRVSNITTQRPATL